MRSARWASVFLLLALVAFGCSTEEPSEDSGEELAGGSTEAAEPEAEETDTAAAEDDPRDSQFFDEAEYTEQLRLRDVEPEGPEGEPWMQALEPEFVDTAEFAAEPGWNVCFSNASVSNPWRVVGFTTMEQEVELHPEIDNFTVVDAEGSDEQQISDIEQLVADGECDALIVSPNTTAALTPAVEAACEQLPVIVFDRGVNTDCPVTFIHPIGGYAFGADAAEFLVDNVPEGGNILGLRILPGVDVLETRWIAGQLIMEEAGLNIVGAEFTEGDAANVNQIVNDYLQRGDIDGVFMDAGATTVAAIEAFEDNGLDIPPINGEDQQDFLAKWQSDGLTAAAPTYPTFQWRTAVIAATQILSGEQVPSEWILPQPLIDNDNLDDYVQEDMPPLHYALCGCEDMPNFPDAWQ